MAQAKRFASATDGLMGIGQAVRVVITLVSPSASHVEEVGQQYPSLLEYVWTMDLMHLAVHLREGWPCTECLDDRGCNI